jgi:hypothetical protein
MEGVVNVEIEASATGSALGLSGEAFDHLMRQTQLTQDMNYALASLTMATDRLNMCHRNIRTAPVIDINPIGVRKGE